MTTIPLQQCLRCIYLTDPLPTDPEVRPTCDAFPDGIPVGVFEGEIIHDHILEELGQKNQFTFVPEEGWEDE